MRFTKEMVRIALVIDGCVANEMKEAYDKGVRRVEDLNEDILHNIATELPFLNSRNELVDPQTYLRWVLEFLDLFPPEICTLCVMSLTRKAEELLR